MVSGSDESASVYGIRLTTVGPGNVTGDVIYEPSNMDLAMKLHYLRVVYFLRSQAVEGVTLAMLKEHIFTSLNYYYEICGRFRRSEATGRPHIKCNDCGTRFIEAKSGKTVDEWIEMMDTSAHRMLVSDQVLGPELTFSPPTLIQITLLKCGGMAVGLSWAHVLGDAFSLAEFMNLWARIMGGHRPTHQPNLSKCEPKIDKQHPGPQMAGPPRSLKRVGPVGDHWITTPPSEMATYSFHVTTPQLTKMLGQNGDGPTSVFHSICAVFWQAIANIRNGPKPRTVTIVEPDTKTSYICRDGSETLSNSQVVSAVTAGFSIAHAHLKDLAELIHERAVDERGQISEIAGKEPGSADFIIYGANLTFVDWEDAPFYEFEFKGMKPSLVSCFVDGIGEEGVVLVLPGPPVKPAEEEGSKTTRIVTVILPEGDLLALKRELLEEWSIA
ncbi:hypothetical protein Nepgr_020328 [Nepenthes gracilis]|uniref:Protein ECERIFERUM 26-like n=1 Tax=Nepenthes gracilis TaxID=150966 RepID=A0AAD3SWV1_NEPGR|nr:hypothetical protein Nepgr_020328 [Nepenthes gracilis]